MRKNSKILTLAVALAVIVTVSACGSKDKTETTASTEAVTEAETTTSAAETKPARSDGGGTDDAEAEAKAKADAEAAAEDEEAEAEAAASAPEGTTASAAGETGSDGVFKAANGRFEIKVPAGWTIDEGSDDEYVTFFSKNGDDMLEIMNISGSMADSVREIYPDTAEAYMKMVNRGDGMEILSYHVNTEDNGSQTFRYSMKYPNPSDGVHFLAGSGSYDAAKEAYISVTGTVVTVDEAVVKQVEEAVNSFVIH